MSIMTVYGFLWAVGWRLSILLMHAAPLA